MLSKGSFNNHVDKKRGEGVSQMSTIVHGREGGGLGNVHVDKILGRIYNFLSLNEYFYSHMRHAVWLRAIKVLLTK